jgi:hypothetical protein
LSQFGAVSNIIGKARRRIVGRLLAEHAAVSLSVFLLTFIVLLVLGTQILDWYWPMLLLAVAAAVGWVRMRGKVPGAYQTAQTLDRELGSHDLLATAYHFRNGGADEGRRGRFITRVLERAEQTAAGVALPDAFRLGLPRQAWISFALLLVACALVGVRYGVLHTLDLRSALIEPRFDTLTGLPEAPEARKGRPGLPPGVKTETVTVAEQEKNAAQAKDTSIAPEDALQTVDVPDVNQAAQDASEKKREGLSSGQEGPNNAESPEPSESSDNAGKDDAGNSPSAAGAPRPNAKQPPNSGSKDANSLLDKMRDAFANLMDKLNIQPKGESGSQTASTGQSKQPNSSQQRMDQKGAPSPGKSQNQGDPDAKSDSDREGDSAEQAQGNKVSEGDKSDEASDQSRSGVGKQEGKKETDLAEQLDAMGKISEILGKRSTNINGEMMVEVQNSKQQLKTPYLSRKAAHADSGGEINRDEIPLHLQSYVQQYYDQVRKTAPQTAPASAPKQ